MKLEFIVDKNHLLFRLIQCDTGTKNIVAFKNFVYKESSDFYGIIRGKTVPGASLATYQQVPKFVRDLQGSARFKKLLAETEAYKDICESQWRANFKKTNEIMRNLTGLPLEENFKVYIVHPDLQIGHSMGDWKIEWGHREEWKNYITVYLWHEIMHSYLPYDDVSHGLIELLTDDELRVRLNTGKYPPFKGHQHLVKIKKSMMLYWQKYLNNGGKNIKKFNQYLHGVLESVL